MASDLTESLRCCTLPKFSNDGPGARATDKCRKAPIEAARACCVRVLSPGTSLMASARAILVVTTSTSVQMQTSTAP